MKRYHSRLNPITFDKNLAEFREIPTGTVLTIRTTPNGSYRNYLSVGKYKVYMDPQFQTEEQVWEHYAYPNKFEMEGFDCRRSFDGEFGKASSRIDWNLLLPKQFFDELYGVALIRVGSPVQKSGIVILN